MKLTHLAIIPDGNRRWAKKHKLASFKGHEKGAETFEKILNKAVELKIPYFSFWGASLDNVTKRSKQEIVHLFKIFEKQFGRLLEDERIMKYEIKIEAIGRWREIFPKKVCDLIEKCIQKTRNNKKMVLTFFLAYNGEDEMIECISAIKEKKEKVTEKTIKKNLWTKNLPALDFIIRTGIKDDPHNSAGFMMWDSAYSQLYFSKTLFPDFNGKELEKAVMNFRERELRKGR